MTRVVKRVSVWSGPRNVSTALMYSFRQRSDTTVVDEPLYGHYLRRTDAPHPGKGEVLARTDTDGERVVRQVLLGGYDTPVVMFKNMAHHLRGLERAFLGELTHVLLTRDPREMLPSLAQKLPAPTLRDTGFVEQISILEYVLAQHQEPIVLEAKALLQNPEGVLREVCRRLGLPFDPAMLSWPAGPKPEDGVWAGHWYKNVHCSRGFDAYTPKPTPFPKSLEPLLTACLPLYEALTHYAVKAS